jgi:PAS domain S-box-containing protein/diguanylate cyclase (GGDEF)-like protein
VDRLTETAVSIPPADGTPVPALVLTRHQDHVESINATLRRAGHAVHCTWLPEATDLADALIQINPELLVVFADERLLPLDAIAGLRARTTPSVPVILVSGEVNEITTTAALRAGAQDVVSLTHPERLQLVCARELRAFRLERALNQTISAARETQRALAAFMEGSADAIAQVQEGIIVDANPAWLELFGYADADAVSGQPVMDFFDRESHAALKGGLSACATGKWADHSLKVSARLADGSLLPLEMVLAQGEFGEDPVVNLCVPSRRADHADVEKHLGAAVRTDPSTGLLHRAYLVEELKARLAQPVRGGMRYIACIKPDRMEAIVGQVGPLEAEEYVAQVAGVARDEASPEDVTGRFTGSSFVFLIARGNAKDAEAWAENLVAKIGSQIYKVGARTLSGSASVGLASMSSDVRDPSLPIREAMAMLADAQKKGGNQVRLVERTEGVARVEANDKVWVHHIKAALMENRFRLVQQPIASLLGEDKAMFDVLVRMLDENAKEVLPSEFIPAAERNDLMKNIDRWVIGAAMSFCVARKPDAIFVRLSKDTVSDPTLPQWIANQLRANGFDTARLCFQVTQEVADQYLLQTQALRDALGKQGYKFAIEHFGAGVDPRQMIERVRPDFVKIDGALMQGIAGNPALQTRVKHLILLAKAIGAQTIAERVEDANTMAVLWQLGVEFVQGYFIHKPEDVVLG